MIKRVLGLLTALAVAACSSAPPERVARAPTALPPVQVAPLPPLPRDPARRSTQQPSRVYADYLLVDKSDRSLTVYHRGQPLKTYFGLQFGDAPIGHKRFEGDERTPEGIYTIDTRNPRSSYYLSLRISYPNAYDRAFANHYGRSPGGDIFIHGQPNALRTGRMRGDWTDGCIALTNDEIAELWQIVPDGTPIEIRL
ncbi:MAG: L,D-transpeptidase family protein [Erythrobacter sp.]